MKKIFMITMALMLLCASTAMAEKSIGWRFGQITKYSSSGWVFKTNEGEMLMGRDSTPFVVETKGKDNKVFKNQINPWVFSVTDDAVDKKIRQLQGQYCAVKYEEELFNVSFNETSYRILDVQPIDKNLSMEPSATDTSNRVTKSDGFRIGRIVKASKKGVLVKTWECIFQSGEAGNQFLTFTIDDEKVFNYAVKCIQSAKKVKIEYSALGALGALSFGDTNYRIFKIEPNQDL